MFVTICNPPKERDSAGFKQPMSWMVLCFLAKKQGYSPTTD